MARAMPIADCADGSRLSRPQFVLVGSPALPELRKLKRDAAGSPLIFAPLADDEDGDDSYDPYLDAVVATWRHVVFIGVEGVHVLDWLPHHPG